MPALPRLLAPRASRDPKRVRELVLEAGTRLFSTHGYAGTSFRDISEASGISVGLIQHHFRTKRALYDAVREAAFAAYVDAQRPQFALPMEAFETFMGKGLRQYFRFVESNPTCRRLAAWSELEGDTRTWPGEDALLDRLVERMTAAQRAGKLRPDIDPELLLILVSGMMQAWIGYRDRHAARLAHLGRREDAENTYLDLCLRLLQHASPDGCASPHPPKTRRR